MKTAPIIELSMTVKSTPQEAWFAWVDSDELENWWGENVILEAKVGGKFQEKWQDDEGNKQLASGKVLKLKKFEYLQFTWREKSWPPKVETTCEIRIEAHGKGTAISLSHSGWENLPPEIAKIALKDFKVGWRYHLKELKAYLDE